MDLENLNRKIIAHIQRILPEPYRTQLEEAVSAEFQAAYEEARLRATESLNQLVKSVGAFEELVARNLEPYAAMQAKFDRKDDDTDGHIH